MERRRKYLKGLITLSTISIAGCTAEENSGGPGNNGENTSDTKSGEDDSEEDTNEGTVDVEFSVTNSGQGRVDIHNSTDQIYKKVPVFIHLTASDSNERGIFNFYDLRPGGSQWAEFETADSESTVEAGHTDLVMHADPDVVPTSHTFSRDSALTDKIGIPIQQDALRSDGDLVPEMEEGAIARIPAEKTGIEDVIEVDRAFESGYSYYYDVRNGTKILDNGDITLPIQGPYWESGQPLRIASTTEEKVIDLFSPRPKFSIEFIDYSLDGQRLDEIKLNITAENQYPVGEARIAGVLNSKTESSSHFRIDQKNIGSNAVFSPGVFDGGWAGSGVSKPLPGYDKSNITVWSKNARFIFNQQLVGRNGSQETVVKVQDTLVEAYGEERAGITEEYTIEPVFEPEFPIEEDEFITLYLNSGLTILAEEKIDLSRIY